MTTSAVPTSTVRAHVANAGEQQQLEWLGGSRMSVLLDSAVTGGTLTVLRTVLQRGDAAPVHVHRDEDEVFVLLSGSAVVWVGDDRYEVGPGGVAFLPRHLPHTYRITEDDTQMLTLATPAGIEGFFRTAGRDLSTPRPEGWAISPAALAEAAAASGVTLLGPPRTD